ncbi:MAG: 4-(cytidine 5'-diphospho)-2-C-methyl-D-erythritol kinase [Planctomycetota bacterium]|nr:MAG: 4-(cytidine 5'-diphospho)-2-C-methyl-D-erythritol kinase [Planctomycetota bacterium]
MYARKTGTAWEIFAPAKLNLYLDVLGRRADGFHELETVMAPVQLHDRLQWAPSDRGAETPFSLRFHPSSSSHAGELPLGRSNLVWQAADALAQDAGLAPHGVITLTKRIPTQAGLGGGSSDAAATLVLLNAAWGLDYSRSRLARLAAQLGSDVPFFLAGSTAICRGRGEIIEPLDDMPRYDVVVVAPPAGVPTAAAFAALGAPPVEHRREPSRSEQLTQLVADLKRGAVAAAGRRMKNGLQHIAETLCPAVRRIGTAFASIACCAHLLTGSGSAYFGVMHSARQARRAAALLRSLDLGSVFATATCR